MADIRFMFPIIKLQRSFLRFNYYYELAVYIVIMHFISYSKYYSVALWQNQMTLKIILVILLLS